MLNALQTGIAFVRGGAKAFDAFWGVDLSPWTYGPLGTVAGVNDTGSSVEGITPDAMARAWLTMYLSGGNLLLHEAAPLFFYTRTGGATTQLSDYGYRAMQLHRLVHGALADRGTPVVPLAILIEEEHGYRGDMVREYHADGRFTFHHEGDTPEQRLLIWNGRTPGLTAGDWQLHRLLTGLWPWPDTAWGKLVGNWPDEARQDPSPDSDPELIANIRVGATDARDYDRCGHDSAWADCFDVIPEDTPGERLATYYKTVLLAGDVRTDNGLWARLDAYASQGGTVVTTLEQLDNDARTALELKPSGQPMAAGLTGARLADGTQLKFHENVLLHTVTPPADATAWATAAASDRPLILELLRGQGRIYVVVIATGLTADTRRLPAVVTALLDHLVARDLGISKRGPGCQMLVNRRADDTLVNPDQPCRPRLAWRGAVHPRRLPARRRRARPVGRPALARHPGRTGRRNRHRARPGACIRKQNPVLRPTPPATAPARHSGARPGPGGRRPATARRPVAPGPANRTGGQLGMQPPLKTSECGEEKTF